MTQDFKYQGHQPMEIMERTLIPMLQDNYCHILIDRSTQKAIAIDPSEAEPLCGFLTESGLELEAIWNTHHHWDHTGGNLEVAQRTGCEIVGAYSDAHRIPGITKRVRHNDQLFFGGEGAKVLETPGHTTGAISFFMEGASGERHVYTGDTLFLGGCGRLFEGTPEMMWQSMLLLRDLPADTLVHCGHEYTAANLRFARHLEPENVDVAERLRMVTDQVQRGEATVPALLSVELDTNPFLRADHSELLESIRTHLNQDVAPGVEAFAFIRRSKDGFQG